ncbi:LOW QUALITY PROTEIN: zinc finger protein GAI-ASSOCIATED FACTOR 1-like [Primulina tabacum]|uniref:LOW QUALITY PROTEIN: zinc finger protein GAI-ASSOCIATED FACTOR 1-like n=1 Tax=Primulina tabacum TaxID=48773 RepID=UPI003F597682
MEINRDRYAKKTWLSQEKYIEKVLQRFNMDQAKAVGCPLANYFKLNSKQSPITEDEEEEMKSVPYASAVGSLMYAMVCTRPDLAHSVGVVSRFLSKSGKEHWAAVKWIFRYLRGTSKHRLSFGGSRLELVGYTNADMAGDVDSRKSTSGYLITFAGGAVSWQSKLQKCVTLSTTEAEFIAATEACKEMLWMKGFLEELRFVQDQCRLFCDSQSAIHLGKNPSMHSRSKHIDVRYHWIRDVLEKKKLKLEKIHTDENGSDMMTKTLPKWKLEYCRAVAATQIIDNDIPIISLRFEFDKCSTVNDPTAAGDSCSGNPTCPPKLTSKKKRNLLGMPDPDSEVIALSPKTLLATNRFVCEICNKGFQRDQNLQLHRRGHNLPWKLKQKPSKDVKRKIYVCPEPSCVHHNPSRALGDLTGIKKHFFRKHGEKAWKCDRCAKKYAVQSDMKAHSKICGTREYRCDCGTLFSRRDSFITHKAFCDALARESAKPHAEAESPVDDEDAKSEIGPATAVSTPQDPASVVPTSTTVDTHVSPVLDQGILARTWIASLLASSGSLQSQTTGFTSLFRAVTCPDHIPELAPSSSSEPISLCLSMNQGSSIFVSPGQELRQYAQALQPCMSATALLQKADLIGISLSNTSLLRGLGIVSSSSSSSTNVHQSGPQIKPDGTSLAEGLALGLACDGVSGLKELMFGTPSVFGPKHITLDLLGLGMAANGGLNGGLTALMTSINDSLDNGAATPPPLRGGRNAMSGSS